MTDIVVPTLGESVSSATVARWLKKAGDAVAADEPLVELETDKVTVEVNAPVAGVIAAIAADTGAEVAPGSVLGSIQAGAAAAAKPAAAAPALPRGAIVITGRLEEDPRVRKLVSAAASRGAEGTVRQEALPRAAGQWTRGHATLPNAVRVRGSDAVHDRPGTSGAGLL